MKSDQTHADYHPIPTRFRIRKGFLFGNGPLSRKKGVQPPKTVALKSPQSESDGDFDFYPTVILVFCLWYNDFMEKKNKKSCEIPIRDIPYSRKNGRISYDYPHKREPHELDFVEILARFGQDIVFIKPSMVKGVGTPDCEWRGKRWEIKTLMNIKQDNIGDLIKGAFRQSKNIILDTSRYEADIASVALEAIKYFTRPKNKHGIMDHEIVIIDGNHYCIINKKVLKSK